MKRATGVSDLVSVTEAAQILGMTRQGVLWRIEQGTPVARRVGRQYVISRDEVEALRSERESA